MIKILYIGNKLNVARSGADQVNFRNQQFLEKIGDVTYISLDHGLFQKLSFSCSNSVLSKIDSLMLNNTYNIVFVQQSLMGRVCKHLKKYYPNIKIIVFFHNIEIQYAKEYIRTIGIRALPFYVLVKLWENIACKYTDFFITLNRRDSELLKLIYNRQSNLELPTSFNDIFDQNKMSQVTNTILDIPVDYLFVGVSFFANVQAVQWFIDNVMPFVRGHFHVVGKGMDFVNFQNLNNRIHIHGFVDDLSFYYYSAKCIVSPIQSGGGMKTKTAEALMYGKLILGSKEAFMGYQLDNRCMILCNSSDDYISAIKILDKDSSTYNKYARNLFTKKYANYVLYNDFRSFIDEIIN